ncbi:hypothetical protein Tco_0278270 [Tanacetum coccineum]
MLIPNTCRDEFDEHVSGQEFGVEYWVDYNNEDDLIPFRKRVFSSAKDGNLQFVLLGLKDRRRIPDWILRDANVKRWPSLYATEPKKDVDHKTYSLFGFTWEFKTWILESFRVGADDYYKRYRRYPRVVAWSSKRKFYRHIFMGRLPIERLTPHDSEARSDWWVSIPSEFDREFKEQKRVVDQLMKKDAERENMYEQGGASSFPTQANNSFFEGAQAIPSYGHNMATPNWQTPMPSYLGTSNWQSQMPSRSATLNWQPLMPSQPVLPKKRGDKTKNKVKNANVSPLNLGNAFADDNVGGDDVMFLGERDTGNTLVLGIHFT